MSLHDQTRRMISLLIFFIFGPVLTLGLIGGIVLRKMPHHAQDMERSIAVQTGLDLRIGSLEYRTPNSIRLNKVRLTEGTTSSVVFAAPEIDLNFVGTEKLSSFFPNVTTPEIHSVDNIPLAAFFVNNKKGFWQIVIPSGEIRLEKLSQTESAAMIRDLFVRFLSRIPTTAGVPVQIQADELNIFSMVGTEKTEGKSTKIRFVSGTIYRADPVYRSDWTFQIPDISETETEKFSIVSNRSLSSIDLELKTGKTPIPCDMAGIFCSTFQAFGSGSLFSGTLSAQYRLDKGNSWNIGLNRASLWQLDVARFAADYTPFAMTGTIRELYVEQATFGHGVFKAKGWVHALDGSIERFLFNRLVENFDLTVTPNTILEAPWGAIPFDQCVVNFELQQDGATFWVANPDSPDLFMVRDQPQKMEVFLPRMNKPVSYQSIFSVLAPDNTPNVPLTPGSQRIMTMIPVDDFVKPTSRTKEIIATTPDNTRTLLEKARKQFAEPQAVPELPRPAVANPWGTP